MASLSCPPSFIDSLTHSVMYLYPYRPMNVYFTLWVTIQWYIISQVAYVLPVLVFSDRLCVPFEYAFVLLFICFAFSFVTGCYVTQGRLCLLHSWPFYLHLPRSCTTMPGSSMFFNIPFYFEAWWKLWLIYIPPPQALAPEFLISPRIPGTLCWKMIRDQVLNTKVLFATGVFLSLGSPYRQR